MNNRLECIASYINNGIGFVDVGTDHGYLAIELCKRGYEGKVFATDINEDPLNKAIYNAKAAGLEERINFSLCDGLDCCPPEKIDTIVIAGMGGDTICSILDRAEWCMDPAYKLILQPMTKAEILRYWLVYNGFGIDVEELVRANGTVYQVIVSRFGGETILNDAELYTGKRELCPNPELFRENLDIMIKRFSKATVSMENAANTALESKIGLNKEILAQLERMYEDA